MASVGSFFCCWKRSHKGKRETKGNGKLLMKIEKNRKKIKRERERKKESERADGGQKSKRKAFVDCFRRPDGAGVEDVVARAQPARTHPLSGFHQVLSTGFQVFWVWMGFTGFYWVLPGFNRFSMLISEFHVVLLGFTGFYQVLQDFV